MDLDGEQSEIANASNLLGILYSDTNRLREAEQEYLRAKQIREKLAQENPSAFLTDFAASCTNLGNLYYVTNRPREAEQEYLRAKQIREKLSK